MLAMLGSVVDSIDLVNKGSGNVTAGKDCFRVFYTRLNKSYREQVKKAGGKYTLRESLELAYKIYWRDAGLELGHYYRVLFNIFTFLENSKNSQPYHAKILRAQLSDAELLLLFYNCLTKSGKPFTELAVKYQLFDNMPTVRLLEDEHINYIDRKAFGDNPLTTSKTARS